MAVILYRKSLVDNEEMQAMQKYFKCYDCMVGIENETVIGRYSCLPFYDEVEKGLQVQNSKLVNSYHQHLYIANFYYYWDIAEFTPKTWFYLDQVPKNEGPYIVKGTTNSKKSYWDTLMYAETREDAIHIACELNKDSLISQQGIIVRKYEPLVNYGIGINGRPWTNEWRCFFYGNQLLSYGFYWSESDVSGKMTDEGLTFVQKIANIISENTNYYTIDIGQKVNGDFTVIEINDGQMAGLSLNDAEILYNNLKVAIATY